MKILRTVAVLVLVASGVALAQEKEESFWYGLDAYFAAAKACQPLADAGRTDDFHKCTANVMYVNSEVSQPAPQQGPDQQQLDALVQAAAALPPLSKPETEADKVAKAIADAQLQEHLQQVAARKAWEWQNQLWLWQAQQEAQAQQQYQQQLLQQWQSQQVQQQWFQRDLVRAIEGLSPTANCWYSLVRQRYVCY